MPDAKQMAMVEAQASGGGIVANGSIDLQFPEVVEHVIRPPCSGSPSEYSQFVLFPSFFHISPGRTNSAGYLLFIHLM